jgi:hypothetical protein
MFIAPDDTLYVVDDNGRKGIFIASAETGVVRQKLDDAVPESVAVDAAGNIYVGETVPGETLTGLAGGNIIRKSRGIASHPIAPPPNCPNHAIIQ